MIDNPIISLNQAPWDSLCLKLISFSVLLMALHPSSITSVHKLLYEDLPGNVFFEIISFPQVEKTNAEFSSTFAML